MKKYLHLLTVIFFLSGFSALIYQISWQRMLFSAFGVDMESVTMIITIFMAGLGVGAYFGGRIADLFPKKLLLLFALTEFGIGSFGLFSADLIKLTQNAFLYSSTFIIALALFVLLILPTFLMGLTLPLLAVYFNRLIANIGGSVGALYFSNTLGAGLGSLITGFYLFNIFTLTETIKIAVSINLSLGLIVLLMNYFIKNKYSFTPPHFQETPGEDKPYTVAKSVVILSFASGFLSLALEVIFMRLFGFQASGIPQGFALILAIFLVGLALGAGFGKNLCLSKEITPNLIGKFFFFAAILDILFISFMFIKADLLFFLLFTFFIASVRGIIFPLVHHLGVVNKNGKSISNIYFANVLGSAIAPLLVGFVLLDYFSTQTVYLFVVALSLLVVIFAVTNNKIKYFAGGAIFSSFLVILLSSEKIIHNIIDRSPEMHLTEFYENRHGLVQVYKTPEGDEKVFGNNVYDGGFNVSLLHDTNIIERAYLMPVIAPKAKKILVIGLSSGSWAHLLQADPDLEEITIVELNQAYLKFAQKHKAFKSLLEDKRVKIVIDDGRRFLNRNPELKFDYIVMNTSWHYRAYVSSLLSQDFFNLAKEHLNKTGFIFVNTTDSIDVFYTAFKTFPYSYKFHNMALGALGPVNFDKDQILPIFAKLNWFGQKVFANDKDLAKGVEFMQSQELYKLNDKFFDDWERKPEIITDDNMLTEYRYGALSR